MSEKPLSPKYQGVCRECPCFEDSARTDTGMWCYWFKDDQNPDCSTRKALECAIENVIGFKERAESAESEVKTLRNQLEDNKWLAEMVISKRLKVAESALGRAQNHIKLLEESLSLYYSDEEDEIATKPVCSHCMKTGECEWADDFPRCFEALGASEICTDSDVKEGRVKGFASTEELFKDLNGKGRSQ